MEAWLSTLPADHSLLGPAGLEGAMHIRCNQGCELMQCSVKLHASEPRGVGSSPAMQRTSGILPACQLACHSDDRQIRRADTYDRRQSLHRSLKSICWLTRCLLIAD